MNKSLMIAVVVGVLLIGGAVYISGQNKGTQAPSTAATQDEVSPSPEEVVVPSIKEFVVENEGLTFKITEMKVKKGDTVKLTFKVTKGNHDWVVDEFNARTKVMQAGQEETIQFVADKAGTFEYYCSVPGHRIAGMKGNLIVEE